MNGAKLKGAGDEVDDEPVLKLSRGLGSLEPPLVVEVEDDMLLDGEEAIDVEKLDRWLARLDR
jgi:hypothetical protein